MRLIRLLKRDLAKEATLWVKDNVISEDQASKICQRYGIDYHDQQSHSYGYYILVSLGYLFIGLSLMTLIGANWDDIPRGLRMGGVIAITVLFHLLGARQFKKEKDNAAIGWFFLGSLSYGAAIMLIAQIYHIGEHYPDGVFWWAMGVLPLALLLRSTTLMLLTATLATIWFFIETDLDYFPSFFPVFLAAIAWHLFKVKQSQILFLGMASGIALFFEYSLAWSFETANHFNFEIEHVVVSGALFVIYYGIAKWLVNQANPYYQDYGTILGVWALRFSIVVLLIFSFEEIWEEFMDEKWQQAGLIITIGLALSGLSIVLAYLGTRSILKTLSTISFALFYLVALFALIYVPDDYSLHMQVYTNLVLIITGIWLIAQGVHEGISHYFYLGVLTVMLTGFFRYIDLVGDYIGAAILFAVFAGILLGVARFWRNNLRKQKSEVSA